MRQVEVELSDGSTIAVMAVPPQVFDDIEEAFPDPDAPVMETETVSGEKLKWSDEKDAGYQRAKGIVERKRSAALTDQFLLWGLSELEVPGDDNWLETIAHSRRVLTGEDWQPPDDAAQRRLLYFKYVLLRNTEDTLRVREAINKLSGISEARVQQIEDSFCRPVEKEAD